jgi:hypothetical protein
MQSSNELVGRTLYLASSNASAVRLSCCLPMFAVLVNLFRPTPRSSSSFAVLVLAEGDVVGGSVDRDVANGVVVEASSLLMERGMWPTSLAKRGTGMRINFDRAVFSSERGARPLLS